MAESSSEVYVGRAGVGSGRSPFCSTCRQLKEPGRENESRCKKCKSDANKARRARKREEKGMAPFKSGRKPQCCRCGGPKEVLTAGYCNKCHSYKARERRKENKKSATFVENERNKVYRRYRDDPDFARKKIVRDATQKYIKAGFLIRKPCEVCGKEKVDAHHDDYNRPFDVRWLCRKHHNEHHRNELNK